MILALLIIAVAAGITSLFPPAASGGTPAPALVPLKGVSTPIQHVVVIYNENHTFDNVLSRLCENAAALGRMPCDGATRGSLPDGTSIPLSDMPDIVPGAAHDLVAQTAAIDGGRMDGFSNIIGCRTKENYRCYTRATAAEIPNLTQLATKFGISDRTFSLTPTSSFSQHINIAAYTPDGFVGKIP